MQKRDVIMMMMSFCLFKGILAEMCCAIRTLTVESRTIELHKYD